MQAIGEGRELRSAALSDEGSRRFESLESRPGDAKALDERIQAEKARLAKRRRRLASV